MTGQNCSTYSFTIPSWISSDWQFFVSAQFFFATRLTFNWIKAKKVAKKGGVKWHKVETLLGGIVILHWKLPREERLRELAGHSVQEVSIVYQRRFQNTPYLYRCSKLFLYQPSKPEIMKLFGKKTEDIVPERKNVWSIVIQVLIAALTALSGVFAGCSLASAWQWRQEEISMWGALDVFK